MQIFFSCLQKSRKTNLIFSLLQQCDLLNEIDIRVKRKKKREEKKGKRFFCLFLPKNYRIGNNFVKICFLV